jgi:hypothetical protein
MLFFFINEKFASENHLIHCELLYNPGIFISTDKSDTFFTILNGTAFHNFSHRVLLSETFFFVFVSDDFLFLCDGNFRQFAIPQATSDGL